jgi:hypothetical protein
MTTNAERKLGERIARELYRDPDYIDDPVLVEYVQGIWQPLLAAARARGDLTPTGREVRVAGAARQGPQHQRLRRPGRLARAAPGAGERHGQPRRARPRCWRTS